MKFFSACTLAVGVGTALAWTSPVLPELKKEDSWLKITEEEGSWVGALLALGAMMGALPAGVFANSVGRKNALLFLALPFLASWIGLLFASEVWMLYVARFIVGLGVGGSCVLVPTYLSEIAEASIRGTLGALFQLFLTVGIVFAFSLGAILDYKMLAFSCAMVEVVFVVTFIFIPESPVWLVVSDRR